MATQVINASSMECAFAAHGLPTQEAAALALLQSLSSAEVAMVALAALLLLSLGVSAGMLVQSTLSASRTVARSHTAQQQRTTTTTTTTDTKTEREKEALDRSTAPKHIAVIMDGNRRFGRETRSDPLQGHWAGGERLADVVQWCMAEGVQALTVYAFSTENWNRDAAEVTALMSIFAKYAETFRVEALKHNVRVCVLSTEFSRLPQNVQECVRVLERDTAHCSAFTLNLCISYSGRSEIVCAVREIVREREQAGHATSAHKDESYAEIDEALVASKLLTGRQGLSDPDLLIRTSGELRLSNFLLWQCAYTELFFVDKYWPQLTQQDLRDIIQQYKQRSRRFGK